MGVSRSPQEFAGKMHKAADNLKRALPPAIDKEALATKKYMEQAARMAAGGDARLSGMKGRKLDVGYKTHGLSAVVFARGPWGLTEFGARPHIISSRRGGGSRRSRGTRLSAAGPSIGRGGRVRGAINIPGIGWRLYARHPGTKGKHTWERRVKMLRHTVGKELIKTSVRVIEQSF